MTVSIKKIEEESAKQVEENGVDAVQARAAVTLYSLFKEVPPEFVSTTLTGGKRVDLAVIQKLIQ